MIGLPIDDEFHMLAVVYHVSICSGLAAIFNIKLLPATVIHVHQITTSYPSVDCSVRYSSATIACMDYSHFGKSLSFCDRKSDHGVYTQNYSFLGLRCKLGV